MARVLVFGAGGPAGMNFVRAAAEAGHDVVPADTDRLRLEAWYGEGSVLMEPGMLDMGWLRQTCARLGIDVVHSQPEGYVLDLAQHRPDFVRHLTPSAHDVLVCQDKFEAGIQWRRDGLRDTPVVRIQTSDDIYEAGDLLGYPYWMRAAHGAGARGATEVHNPDMGYHWWQYWGEREVGWEFIAEEFLPGRDYAWTSIWYEGHLVCSTARERLEYMYPHLAPSGRTGTPVVAQIVHDEAVNVMATEAVLSISPAPHGTYCVDLRCDREGTPRPTEINCGRFFTTSYHTAAMGVNFPDIYICLALGQSPPAVDEYNALPEGYAWVRHMDCPGVVVGPAATVRSFHDQRRETPDGGRPLWSGISKGHHPI